MSDVSTFKIDIFGKTEDEARFRSFFGHSELETRFRPEGRDFIGEGRTKRFNEHGCLVEDTGWRPTGVRLIAPPEPVWPWWKFWG